MQTPTPQLPPENEEIAAELRYLESIDDKTATAHVLSSDDLPAGALDRDLAIKLIRFNLKARSGKSWSVKGSRGSAWGWITITAPPARRVKNELTAADAQELGDLLGLPDHSVYTDLEYIGQSNAAHRQGVSIAADREWYLHYIDASAGAPSEHGTPQYWD